MRFFAIIMLAGLAFPAWCAPTVHLQGDTVTIRAKQSSLQEVLQGFAYAGVFVEFDPGVKAKVDGDLINLPVEKALDQLLGSFSYVIKWDTIKGPVGDYPKLSKISVFRPGHERAARALPESSRHTFDVVEVDGTRWVRDELLLGLKERTTMEELRALLATVNGTIVSSIPELGVYQIKLPLGSDVAVAVRAIRQFPKVASVEPNYVIRAQDPVNTAPAGPSKPSASPPASSGAAAVAVLDTGLKPEVNLGSLVQGWYDSTNPGQSANDGSGHGSQMAMIATGAVTPTGFPGGEAAGVPVLAVRAFDENGNASNFSLMRSIDYAVANNARIVSMSWGTTTDSDFLSRTIAYAQGKSLLVVAAAGNEPTGEAMYPAAYAGVIAVGALNAQGELWDESNYGSFVDVVAPGHATFPVGHNGPPGSYIGTSISTPWVARAFSQYSAMHPDHSQETMLKAFYSSLTDAGPAGKDEHYGRGIFDESARQKFFGFQ